MAASHRFVKSGAARYGRSLRVGYGSRAAFIAHGLW
jgi:hypothetical protein